MFKSWIAWVVAGFLTLLALGALAFFIVGTDVFLDGYFSPKREAIRRNTFEQSKSYNDGMAQELEKMQFEYLQAPPEQKRALRGVIVQRFSTFDVSRLPENQQTFLVQLRQERVAP